MRERIVITGIGAVTPLGPTAETTWNSLVNMRSGIKDRKNPYPGSEVLYAGHVENFNPLDHFTVKEVKRLHRSVQFGVVAAEEALRDADLLKGDSLKKKFDSWRVGVAIGTGTGGTPFLLEADAMLRSVGRVRSDSALQYQLERVASVVSMRYGLHGPSEANVAACASSGKSISAGLKTLLLDDADIMVVGGTEATLEYPVAFATYEALKKALSIKRCNSPDEASRPFDTQRDGFVMSEGAAVLVLEKYAHAKARGAKIYAEFLGYADTSDAAHETAPSGEGGYQSEIRAIRKAGLEPKDIEYINAHGTGTIVGDPKELAAMLRLRGGNLSNLSISATKSQTGHMLGAAGAVEALITALVINRGIVTATANLENVTDISPEDLERYELDESYKTFPELFPTRPIEREVNVGMTNTLGFGGMNNSLVLGRCR